MSSDNTKQRREQEMQARIDERVKQLVDQAPPLDSATREKLALLLRGAKATRVASGSSVAVSPVAGTRSGSGGSS